MSDPTDLDEAQRLADAATPGPWRKGELHAASEVWADRDAGGWDGFLVAECTTRLNPEVGDQSDADAEFIVASRSLVPQLVGEVRGLRVQVEQLTRAKERLELAASMAEVMDGVAIWRARAELHERRADGLAAQLTEANATAAMRSGQIQAARRRAEVAESKLRELVDLCSGSLSDGLFYVSADRLLAILHPPVDGETHA